MKVLSNKQMLKIADTLIPQHNGTEITAFENGNTQDIISEILKTDKKNPLFMRRFARAIQGPTVRQTLLNLWTFTKYNVRYQVDELGIQKIKTAPAIWWTRVCDCKGYALFIRSILKNLGIHSQFKFAGYDENRDYTHVYVIVPKSDGSYTTIDGCMPGFDHEKPTVKFLLK